MEIKSIISSVFTNRIDETSNLLHKHDLVLIIEKYYECIVEDRISLDKIESAAAMFLTELNRKISTAETKNKMILEYVVADLTKFMFSKWILESQINKQLAIDRIFSGLEMSCRLNNWNFEEVKRFFNIEMNHAVKVESISINNHPTNYYYTWCSSVRNLGDLASCLYDRKAIQRKNLLHDLFDEPNSHKNLTIEPSRLDVILVLFDELYNRKLIIPRGYKAKKFTPLKMRLMDLEGNYLLKNDPKRYFYRTKKNKAEYLKIQRVVKNWIDNYEAI